MVLQEFAPVGLDGREQDVIGLYRHVARLHIAVNVLGRVLVLLLAHVGDGRLLAQSVDAVDDAVYLLLLVLRVGRAVHREPLLLVGEYERWPHRAFQEVRGAHITLCHQVDKGGLARLHRPHHQHHEGRVVVLAAAVLQLSQVMCDVLAAALYAAHGLQVSSCELLVHIFLY